MASLDLRDQVCPMSLLLMKRHVVLLEVGQTTEIWVTDPSSKSDIVRFLEKNAYTLSCTKQGSDFCLLVTKEKEPC
ncbi:sulfurtransferase TusA family protein [Vibrio sp. LaRot3]|uniref:sulfurtransferase TusA family protein n=1 Tax=Vibrio sp. LaRot3 TaxID=2998829 RepID=UPI0022CDC067|nr:sulfurtransferase TusA family protein [Vibrio sp. LaRot3]MDA0146980.1 sulfurtransferase TusA family protein [Vibrio sp. LaRot3]